MQAIGTASSKGKGLKRPFGSELGQKAAPELSGAEVLAYTSGSNRTCDIIAASAAGVPTGVDVSKTSEKAIQALINSKVPLLLDSGAFSEVSFRASTPLITKPISENEWRRRLQLYLRIAKQVARRKRRDRIPALSVIAPDQVANQEKTLERLQLFRGELVRLRATGAEILVPMQCGRLTAVEFYRSVVSVLGFSVVPAMPMKKAPRAAAEVLSFVREVRLIRLHLLGIGFANRNAKTLLSEIWRIAPGLFVSVDSNRIRAAVGEKRAITVNEKRYCEDFLESANSEMNLSAWSEGNFDMTELVFSPSEWLHQVMPVKTFASSLTWLSPAERAEFTRDPDTFLRTNEIDQWVIESLMHAYWRFVSKPVRRAARARAVATFLRADTAKHKTLDLPHT